MNRNHSSFYTDVLLSFAVSKFLITVLIINISMCVPNIKSEGSKAPTWHLHTKSYKFGWNTFPNNARMKDRRDLNLDEVLYTSVIYYIPDSWLTGNLLNGYDLKFWWRDSENQLYIII